ncbi:hypothetical protein DCAR_0934020 [Daucus carota subsp. sativus]|uniref:RING-type E3 ubiquitin transferase n=1 Tax=Daucus carota subsp. sativus TaxID=79200 RepID=A0AAF0XUF7_DAUCS|nr:hypothetical protein DCAR_0934020 [Daucus carota subsp. sativus]
MEGQVGIVTQLLETFLSALLRNKASIAIFLMFFILFRLLIKKFLHHHYHIPHFTFNQNPKSEPLIYCAVCLHDVANGEMCRKLPQCEHCFHVDCIDVWLRCHLSCPLCRSRVDYYLSKDKNYKSGFSSYILPVIRKFA